MKTLFLLLALSATSCISSPPNRPMGPLYEQTYHHEPKAVKTNKKRTKHYKHKKKPLTMVTFFTGR